MTAERPYTLQWDAPLPLKVLPLSMSGSGPPSNTWFPGPTRVLNPNGISIGSAVFARLTSVTDRPTDQATRSVTIGRIYVRTEGTTYVRQGDHHVVLFLSSSFFFSRLISAVADWMSTILLHMAWP